MILINMTDKYITRNGREVEVFATDLAGSLPVGAVVNTPTGRRLCQYTLDGRFKTSGQSPEDLILAKKKGVAWVNIYPEGLNGVWASREAADRMAGPNRIARIRVEWTEGQFDE